MEQNHVAPTICVDKQHHTYTALSITTVYRAYPFIRCDCCILSLAFLARCSSSWLDSWPSNSLGWLTAVSNISGLDGPRSQRASPRNTLLPRVHRPPRTDWGVDDRRCLYLSTSSPPPSDSDRCRGLHVYGPGLRVDTLHITHEVRALRMYVCMHAT